MERGKLRGILEKTAILEYGKTHLHLENIKKQLEQVRSEANDVAKQLRVIADCFDQKDEDLSNVKVIRTGRDNSFESMKDRHRAAYGTGTAVGGAKTQACWIPQDLKGTMDRILGLEKDLQKAEKEFETSREKVDRMP